MDDAGGGYAGLQQVMRMGADIIKLDRALVQDIHTDRAKAALVRSLQHFASDTGAQLCAEGIESADELRTLVDIGVELGQGFLLARPGPAVVAGARARVHGSASRGRGRSRTTRR